MIPVRYMSRGEENRARQQCFATILLILMASAAPPATKPVVHSFPSDLVEAEAAQRAKEEIRRKVEAELVAALTSLETAKNARAGRGRIRQGELRAGRV